MENITNYNSFIQNILDERGRFICDKDIYYERHHITPRCMGGTDDENNLIDLYAKEHYIAHKLLAEENPDNEKIGFAFWSMSMKSKRTNNRYVLTSEEYEECKIAFSKSQSKLKKELFSNKENHPLYGRHHSDEAKEKMRLAKLGKPSCKKGIPLSEEQKAKMSISLSGCKWTDDQHEKMDGRYADGKSTCCIPIYCPELDEEFWGLQDVHNKYGFSKPNINKCLKGIRKHCGIHPVTGEQLTWQYLY